MWKENKKKLLQSSFIFLPRSYWYLQLISTEEPGGLADSQQKGIEMSQKWGQKGDLQPPALWDSIPSTLELCVTAWPSGWFSACPGRERVKFQMGKKEHVLLDHNQFFSVKTDFSLAPAQRCCSNQTLKEAESNLSVELFNCFQKVMFPPKVCAQMQFPFQSLGESRGRQVAEVFYGCTLGHVLVVGMCCMGEHAFLSEEKTLLFAAELWAKSTVRESSVDFCSPDTYCGLFCSMQ